MVHDEIYHTVWNGLQSVFAIQLINQKHAADEHHGSTEVLSMADGQKWAS